PPALLARPQDHLGHATVVGGGDADGPGVVVRVARRLHGAGWRAAGAPDRGRLVRRGGRGGRRDEGDRRAGDGRRHGLLRPVRRTARTLDRTGDGGRAGLVGRDGERRGRRCHRLGGRGRAGHGRRGRLDRRRSRGGRGLVGAHGVGLVVGA